jgi:hypothetical protein
MPASTPAQSPETPPVSETIATYTLDDETYEIDHLGIGHDHQWGGFAVYWNGMQVAEFWIQEAGLKPEHRPDELPVTDDELIRLAKEAVEAEDA